MSEPGRNDPCPCGSGKKYKKCCLLNQPKPYEDLHKDFALGQQLLAEYENSLKERLQPRSFVFQP